MVINVCKERDFNRIESATLPPDALETALSQFEGLVGVALTEIQRAPESISWSNWNILLNRIARAAELAHRIQRRQFSFGPCRRRRGDTFKQQ